ncbi:Kelch repeat-containing protein [Pedobacter insulae]|nr:hypothetical protein [Pedobacter insulae]
MKNTTFYLTLLITTILTPNLLAQKANIHDIAWIMAGNIPPAHQQNVSVGLAGAAIGVLANKLVLAGGNNFPDQMPWEGGKKRYYDDIFVYAKSTTGLTLADTNCKWKLPFNLAYSAVCSTPKGMVIAGGENENGLVNKVLLLTWNAGALTTSYLPDLPNGLTNAALTYKGDKLYVAGGENADGASNQFLSLNLNALNDGWKALEDLPHPVSHTVLVSAGDEIYLISGRMKNVGDTSTIYNQVYAFKLSEHTWTTKNAMPYPVSAATGIVKGNDILIFSGDEGKTFHETEKLIATIDREKDTLKKETLNRQKAKLQEGHPGFAKTVLKYSLLKGNWTVLKSTMPYGTVTTTAVIFDEEIVVAGGEIRAGVRTPHILVGKIKYTK